jgi:hypothetical protein
MQSRIFEIASLFGAEPSRVKKSCNRHFRFATEFVDFGSEMKAQMRGRFANFF